MEFDYQYILDYSKDIIIAFGIVLFVGLEFWLINKESTYLKTKARKLNFGSIKFQSFHLLGAEKQKFVIVGVISIFHVTTILTVIYFSLILILSIFPVTEGGGL